MTPEQSATLKACALCGSFNHNRSRCPWTPRQFDAEHLRVVEANPTPAPAWAPKPDEHSGP